MPVGVDGTVAGLSVIRDERLVSSETADAVITTERVPAARRRRTPSQEVIDHAV